MPKFRLVVNYVTDNNHYDSQIVDFANKKPDEEWYEFNSKTRNLVFYYPTSDLAFELVNKLKALDGVNYGITSWTGKVSTPVLVNGV